MRAVATVVVAAALLGGCVSDHTAFRRGDEVHVVHPADGQVVTLPVELRWEPTATAGAGPARFVVFVDREPMPPGQGLEYVVRDDRTCQRTPGCPDAAYLAQFGVHVVDGTRLAVSTLDDTRPRSRSEALEVHSATIVALDDAGVRPDETAYTVTFRIRRKP